MLIDCFREKLLIASCCDRAEGGLIEIPNSVREKELKKVWVDCSDADDALLIRLGERRTASYALCSAGQDYTSKRVMESSFWRKTTGFMRCFAS